MDSNKDDFIPIVINNSSFNLLKIIFQSDVSLVETYYSKAIENLQNLLRLSPIIYKFLVGMKLMGK